MRGRLYPINSVNTQMILDLTSKLLHQEYIYLDENRMEACSMNAKGESSPFVPEIIIYFEKCYFIFKCK